MTAHMTIAEIAVRLAAGYNANAGAKRLKLSHIADEAEALYAELVKRGHIKPEPAPAPVAGPDWSQAPEWAQWVAMDEDGVWYWFATEPYIRGCMWVVDDGPNMQAPPPNWRESLQRRPGGG